MLAEHRVKVRKMKSTDEAFNSKPTSKAWH